MLSYLGREDYQQLAGATKTAVKLIGGSTRAAEVIGMKLRQTVEKWYRMDGSDDDVRSIPLFAIADIESDIVDSGGIPPITSALADLHGFELRKINPAPSNASAVRQLGTAMKEMGEACEKITGSYAGGNLTLTLAVRDECLAEIDDAIREMDRLKSILHGEKVVDHPRRTA